MPKDDPESFLKGVLEIGAGYAEPKVLMGACDVYRRCVSHNSRALQGQFKLLACLTDEINALLDKWNQIQ